jgi:hypothetical protein
LNDWIEKQEHKLDYIEAFVIDKKGGKENA